MKVVSYDDFFKNKVKKNEKSWKIHFLRFSFCRPIVFQSKKTTFGKFIQNPILCTHELILHPNDVIFFSWHLWVLWQLGGVFSRLGGVFSIKNRKNVFFYRKPATLLLFCFFAFLLSQFALKKTFYFIAFLLFLLFYFFYIFLFFFIFFKIFYFFYFFTFLLFNEK